MSSEGWHFRRAKINPWGRCPIIDLVLVLVLGLKGLVLVLVLVLVLGCLVLVLGLEGQVLVNITASDPLVERVCKYAIDVQREP